jgi:hypothetical protein
MITRTECCIPFDLNLFSIYLPSFIVLFLGAPSTFEESVVVESCESSQCSSTTGHETIMAV